MMTVPRIRLGRDDVTLRPTFGAVEEIEHRLDASIGQLYQVLGLGALKLAEMAVIVTEGARAGKQELRAEDVARALFERGIHSDDIRLPLARFLLECLHGPEAGSKKFEAEWRGSTPPTPPTAPAPANTSTA